jgi:hypothetical protein
MGAVVDLLAVGSGAGDVRGCVPRIMYIVYCIDMFVSLF